MRIIARSIRALAVLLVLLPGRAAANDWDAFEVPGAIAIMRHASAPGTGDPPSFALGDCATQRNLDARGRDQARRIGAAFRERGIAFDRILASQWCRTTETAELLGLGTVDAAPPLNSFFGSPSRRARQTADTLALIRETPGRLMLVTHQVNISALTGRFTRSGEVLVLRIAGGEIEVLGSVLIAP